MSFRTYSDYRDHHQFHSNTDAQSAMWSNIDLIAQIADLKQDNYRLTLALSTLMELLVEKGIVEQDDISRKALELDQFLELTDE
ncbi:hypothetical protein [Paenibacillus assamensis]|uniref:hypothetical protein n=1 Tax=Paenibacillus assamensis TaxID=311244 RepID=UPI000404E18D